VKPIARFDVGYGVTSRVSNIAQRGIVMSNRSSGADDGARDSVQAKAQLERFALQCGYTVTNAIEKLDVMPNASSVGFCHARQR
jgi:hypothetical protein